LNQLADLARFGCDSFFRSNREEPTMKSLLIALAALLFATAAQAQDQYVNGYYKSNGTYVQGYYRTAPDNTTLNNYSTQGNVNPYTGQAGTKNPYAIQNNGGWTGSGSSNQTLGGSNNGLYGGQSCTGLLC
jgi:hypothetical protein